MKWKERIIMSSFDLINMAVRNLWKRKMRTFLTVLGVIIGTASIVVMISVGIGMNEGYKTQIEEMGSLTVINVNVPYSADTSKNKEKVELNAKTLEQISQITGVEAVTPVKQDYFTIIDGRYVYDTSVMGILPETMEQMGFKVQSGRTLQEGDSMAIVLSAYALEGFYNPKLSWQYRWNSSQSIEINPYEDKFQITYDNSYGTKDMDKSIKPKKVEVVGVMNETDQNSYVTIMSLKDLEKIVAEREKYQKKQDNPNNNSSQNSKKGVYDRAMVKVTDMNDVEDIQKIIKDMGFETYSLVDYLNSAQETSKMLQMVLGAIGAISLFVAAIGIANTMVMSIYERTREIGVMKVIGATVSDIRRLFLTEAAFIGFMGGLVGMGLSFGVSKIVNVVSANMGRGDSISMIPIWLAIVGVGFATLVGVLAGFFPAVRATKLSALAAIKTE